MYNVWTTTKLTLELREIVTGTKPINIWDFDYPSYYKDEFKTAFEKKVIDHFYFRQIGFETVGRFLHHFQSKVREIMPYYIQLYKSVEIMNGLENPFDNVDVTETFEQETTNISEFEGSHTLKSESGGKTDTTSNETGEIINTTNVTNNTNTSNNNNKAVKFSDTPQGVISNINSHLTNYTEETNTGTSTNNSTTTDNTTTSNTQETSLVSNIENTVDDTGTSTNQGTVNSTVKHTYHKKGNQGVNTYAHDIIEYRTSLIEVDMMIIEELENLFLKIY